jgi:hypothetical protein
MQQVRDKLLVTARREAALVLVVWVLALTYTVSVSYFWGYRRAIDDLRFVLGIPDWVFWGIVVPWFACLGFNFWFSFWFMQDGDIAAESPQVDDPSPRGGAG